MPDSINATYVERDPRARPAADSRPSATARAPDQAAAVELREVAHRLGHRWALRGVTLRVDPGETLAILGPNGSGKTTLLRVVGTALTPTRGSGRVFGHDLVAESDTIRKITGMLGHATSLYEDLTAAENLGFALRMCGMLPSRTAIDGALEAVGLRSRGAERVRELSSGMRRRVALARLVLRRPRLLLLDEPYNSLDAAGIAVVDSLIREATRAGGAVLVVTHDLDEMDGAGCHRVLRLSAGRAEVAT